MSEILQGILKKFPLPQTVDNLDGEGFDDFIARYLSDYVGAINTMPTPIITPAGSNAGVRTDIIISDITNICQGLSEIMNIYLKGQPATAYHAFEKLIDDYALGKQLLRLRINKIKKYTPFYRTQGYHKNPLPATGASHNTWMTKEDPRELFHPPFNKRKRVGTNRFSIPGYPCLYISDKLSTSFKEATQKNIAPVSAICLRNNRPLYIANISPLLPTDLNDPSRNTDINYINELLTYSLIFPLVAASHFKIAYKEDYDNEVKFKVEYIIPQLLLQWFQKHAKLFIDGIKYMSCSAAMDPTCCMDDQYNYILTTEENKPDKLCPKLSRLFDISPVLFINPLGATAVDTIITESEKELSAATTHPL